MYLSPQRRAIFSTSEQTKVLQTRHVLHILTCKCAFRHSARQFFDSRTSKSAPKTTVFEHFDFQMCFSPQRRAIFRHLNRQKCSEAVMFLYILTFKCAFRHSGVQFFDIWTDKSAPKPSCFVHFDFQMCFSPQRRAIFDFASEHRPPHLLDWPDTRIIEKTQHFATSLTFGGDVSSFFWLSRYCIFCRLTWRLYYCFSTLHIVGSFYLNFLRLVCTNSKLTTYLKDSGFHKRTATVTTTFKEGIYLGVWLGLIISLPNITSLVSPMSLPLKKTSHCTVKHFAFAFSYANCIRP